MLKYLSMLYIHYNIVRNLFFIVIQVNEIQKKILIPSSVYLPSAKMRILFARIPIFFETFI